MFFSPLVYPFNEVAFLSSCPPYLSYKAPAIQTIVNSEWIDTLEVPCTLFDSTRERRVIIYLSMRTTCYRSKVVALSQRSCSDYKTQHISLFKKEKATCTRVKMNTTQKCIALFLFQADSSAVYLAFSLRWCWSQSSTAFFTNSSSWDLHVRCPQFLFIS